MEIKDFDASILNWSLKKGSHTFPGPEGGTCINEAAIVAAGFEYKAVKSWRDCPPCFSPVLAAYALSLNDRMPDSLRNPLLMPFVTRLAGTHDTLDVEKARAVHIALGMVRNILPITLRHRGMTDLADRLAATATLDLAATLAVAREIRIEAQDRRVAALKAHYVARNKRWAAEAAEAAAEAEAAEAAAAEAAAAEAAAAEAEAAAAAAAAAEAAAEAAEAWWFPSYPTLQRELWTATTVILDGAMRIGRQPEALEIAVVKDRMDAIRKSVAA
ncbi:hypothetical protein [Phenylobacterium sp.]|uniref:hypothetical protein n=1 Tax=Phenylobacterium sp. TaxID=1871053 RepID=UPI0025D4DE2D|nr:hypothetical protein [Phenylobacterium sp.]MBX3482503.1 hypothetical protein [Phenylobacterium sp.]